MDWQHSREPAQQTSSAFVRGTAVAVARRGRARMLKAEMWKNIVWYICKCGMETNLKELLVLKNKRDNHTLFISHRHHPSSCLWLFPLLVAQGTVNDLPTMQYSTFRGTIAHMLLSLFLIKIIHQLCQGTQAQLDLKHDLAATLSWFLPRPVSWSPAYPSCALSVNSWRYSVKSWLDKSESKKGRWVLINAVLPGNS